MSDCEHDYRPKYFPLLMQSSQVSRCTKCGYERWTSFDQMQEWRENGLDGKQIDSLREREESND